MWRISVLPSYSINPAEWLSPLRRWLLMRPISRRLIFVLMIGHPRNFTDNRDAREEDSVLGRETNGSRRFDGIPPIEVPCHSLYTFVILTSFLLKPKSWSNRMLWRLCVSGHFLILRSRTSDEVNNLYVCSRCSSSHNSLKQFEQYEQCKQCKQWKQCVARRYLHIWWHFCTE